MSHTLKKLPILGLVLSAALATTASHADTVNARCKLFPSGPNKASMVTPCTFSQRQGYIGVELLRGKRYDFSPLNKPGRYTDQNGDPVFRQPELGQHGIKFRMKAHTLYVYWIAAAKTLLTLPAANAPFAQQFSWGKIKFDVQSTNSTGPNMVIVTPSGLAIDNRPKEAQIQGQLVSAEVADINRDGSPELYLYIRSNENPPRMQLLAYSVNRGKSMSDIVLSAPSNKPEYSEGYRGWDQFSVVESSLVQRFPVFADQAADTEPSSVRQIRYRLFPGEANWQLVADKAEEF